MPQLPLVFSLVITQEAKNNCNKLFQAVFSVLFSRRCKRISGTEKKTNASVRMEIGIEEDETLQQTALRRKLGFFGHVMRSDGLEKGMMLAHGDGRRRRGRPRTKWMDEIHEVTGMKLAELRDVTTERKNLEENGQDNRQISMSSQNRVTR